MLLCTDNQLLQWSYPPDRAIGQLYASKVAPTIVNNMKFHFFLFTHFAKSSIDGLIITVDESYSDLEEVTLKTTEKSKPFYDRNTYIL